MPNQNKVFLFLFLFLYLIEEVEKKSCAVEKVQDYLLIGPRKYNIFATQLRGTCSYLLL